MYNTHLLLNSVPLFRQDNRTMFIFQCVLHSSHSFTAEHLRLCDSLLLFRVSTSTSSIKTCCQVCERFGGRLGGSYFVPSSIGSSTTRLTNDADGGAVNAICRFAC